MYPLNTSHLFLLLTSENPQQHVLKLSFNCLIAVPSQPPTSISLTARTSTTIEVSWKPPPEDARNGIIKGFKLYYKKKNNPGSLTTFLLVDNGAARSEMVTGLAKYTEYEFQVLAYTSAGDGPKSSVKYNTTLEDGNKY